MSSSLKGDNKAKGLSFPTPTSNEIKNRVLPPQLLSSSPWTSVDRDSRTVLDSDPRSGPSTPSTTTPSPAAKPPSPIIQAPNDWITCHVSHDAYSRTMTNIKFLLPRHAAAMTAVPNASTTQYLLPAYSHPENRFTTTSLGYVCDMWPQLIDDFIPGSPYNASGMVKAAMAQLNEDDDDDDDAAVEKKGIIFDDETARKWVKYWYATTSMTVQVHRGLPREGVDWLWTKVWAESIRDGRMDVRVVVADGEGVVATGALSVMVVQREAQGAAAGARDQRNGTEDMRRCKM